MARIHQTIHAFDAVHGRGAALREGVMMLAATLAGFVTAAGFILIGETFQ